MHYKAISRPNNKRQTIQYLIHFFVGSLFSFIICSAFHLFCDCQLPRPLYSLVGDFLLETHWLRWAQLGSDRPNRPCLCRWTASSYTPAAFYWVDALNGICSRCSLIDLSGLLCVEMYDASLVSCWPDWLCIHVSGPGFSAFCGWVCELVVVVCNVVWMCIYVCVCTWVFPAPTWPSAVRPASSSTTSSCSNSNCRAVTKCCSVIARMQRSC